MFNVACVYDYVAYNNKERVRERVWEREREYVPVCVRECVRVKGTHTLVAHQNGIYINCAWDTLLVSVYETVSQCVNCL